MQLGSIDKRDPRFVTCPMTSMLHVKSLQNTADVYHATSDHGQHDGACLLAL